MLSPLLLQSPRHSPIFWHAVSMGALCAYWSSLTRIIHNCSPCATSYCALSIFTKRDLGRISPAFPLRHYNLGQERIITVCRQILRTPQTGHDQGYGGEMSASSEVGVGRGSCMKPHGVYLFLLLLLFVFFNSETFPPWTAYGLTFQLSLQVPSWVTDHSSDIT